ncbi:MAG: lipid-A-disaccharide synthase N-terminal domain-containing protein, partial [Robiginitomaculum sp.]|nr:lipid-A-disaccharide synthase N-terminal domain-containing protein [Robiginitomaculum sp.]
MNEKFANKNPSKAKMPKAKTHTAKTLKPKTPKHGARYVAAHGVREVLVDGTPLDIALSGQALFAARTLIQWLRSEGAGRCVLPANYWWLSIAGSSFVLFYSLKIGDTAFAAGSAINRC